MHAHLNPSQVFPTGYRGCCSVQGIPDLNVAGGASPACFASDDVCPSSGNTDGVGRFSIDNSMAQKDTCCCCPPPRRRHESRVTSASALSGVSSPLLVRLGLFTNPSYRRAATKSHSHNRPDLAHSHSIHTPCSLRVLEPVSPGRPQPAIASCTRSLESWGGGRVSEEGAGVARPLTIPVVLLVVPVAPRQKGNATISSSRSTRNSGPASVSPVAFVYLD